MNPLYFPFGSREIWRMEVALHKQRERDPAAYDRAVANAIRESQMRDAADTAKRRSTTPPTGVNAKNDNREDQK